MNGKYVPPHKRDDKYYAQLALIKYKDINSWFNDRKCKYIDSKNNCRPTTKHLLDFVSKYQGVGLYINSFLPPYDTWRLIKKPVDCYDLRVLINLHNVQDEYVKRQIQLRICDDEYNKISEKWITRMPLIRRAINDIIENNEKLRNTDQD